MAANSGHRAKQKTASDNTLPTILTLLALENDSAMSRTGQSAARDIATDQARAKPAWA